MKQSPRTKRTTIKINITAIAILTIVTACTTAKTRDQHIVENLELQNAVIDAARADREAPEVKQEVEKSEALKEAEVKLSRALDSLKAANGTVVSKIKPDQKNECRNINKDGDADEQ